MIKTFARLSGASLALGASPALAAELSPFSMFMAADIVVKAVMIGLALASVASWTVLFAKKLELARAGKALAGATQVLMSHNTLGKGEPTSEAVTSALVAAARNEISRSGAEASADGIKERIALRFARIEAAEARAAAQGVSILASIGATGPFVGLFGTVWGIMNSFIGIARSQTTNLAVVAPGIAEALLATAIGLVAAIPAVLFYNHLTRAVSGHRALVTDAATAAMLLASRELDSVRPVRVAAE
jgi:biopolymer transport protein ExbB